MGIIDILCLNKRVFFLLLITTAVLLSLQLSAIWTEKRNLECSSLRDTHEGSKWIVMTTINEPTETVRLLSKMKGWKVVVVGDMKTPQNWNHPNCVFLSVEKQNALGYEITKHLPNNHYSRKNIGYLYAIQQGATLIYETDDDNQPLRADLGFLPEYTTLSEISGKSGVVNPYVHFGEPTVWPRGYPLDQIQDQAIDYKTPVKIKASIQQGIANNDPDVDAIFRLTRTLGITFDPCAKPVAVDRGQMTPYNSQTTFFYSSAFWGLIIPVTTTFRVCDIWRGYFTQRLLWEIGGSLTFLPANVIQYRNPHQSMRDFEEEQDLYHKAGPLVQFLRAWRSDDKDILTMAVSLAEDMYHQGFWDFGDVELMRAWTNDLKRLGYVPPAIVSHWESSLPPIPTVPPPIPPPPLLTVQTHRFETLLSGYKDRLKRVLAKEEEGKYVSMRAMGGLGNRLPPIVSAFALALLTDRLLTITFPRQWEPFDEFYNEVFEGIPIARKVFEEHGVFKNPTHLFNTGLETKDLTQDLLDTHDSIFVESNDYYLLALEMNPLFRNPIREIFGQRAFAMIAPHLFVPVPVVAEQIELYRGQFNRHTIGMQIRTKRFAAQIDPKVYFRLARFVQQSRNWTDSETSFFLATDEPNFVGLAKEFFAPYKQQVITTPLIQQFEKNDLHSALLDMRLMSLCDELIISFGSSYGAAAAAWGNITPIYVNLDNSWFGGISPDPCFWGASRVENENDLNNVPALLQAKQCYKEGYDPSPFYNGKPQN